MSKIKYLSQGTVKTIFVASNRLENENNIEIIKKSSLETVSCYICSSGSELASDLKIFCNNTTYSVMKQPSSFTAYHSTINLGFTQKEFFYANGYYFILQDEHNTCFLRSTAHSSYNWTTVGSALTGNTNNYLLCSNNDYVFFLNYGDTYIKKTNDGINISTVVSVISTAISNILTFTIFNKNNIVISGYETTAQTSIFYGNTSGEPFKKSTYNIGPTGGIYFAYGDNILLGMYVSGSYPNQLMYIIKSLDYGETWESVINNYPTKGGGVQKITFGNNKFAFKVTNNTGLDYSVLWAYSSSLSIWNRTTLDFIHTIYGYPLNFHNGLFWTAHYTNTTTFTIINSYDCVNWTTFSSITSVNALSFYGNNFCAEGGLGFILYATSYTVYSTETR